MTSVVSPTVGQRVTQVALGVVGISFAILVLAAWFGIVLGMAWTIFTAFWGLMTW